MPLRRTSRFVDNRIFYSVAVISAHGYNERCLLAKNFISEEAIVGDVGAPCICRRLATQN
jgi:hypothetical protein